MFCCAIEMNYAFFLNYKYHALLQVELFIFGHNTAIAIFCSFAVLKLIFLCPNFHGGNPWVLI